MSMARRPRIRTIAPRLATIRPLVSSPINNERERTRYRDATQPWRAWYKTARWQKLRWSVLVRDNFTCKMCGKVDVSKGGLHCDHVEPHHGNEEAFWAGPFQTLCAHCHNSLKQRSERRG